MQISTFSIIMRSIIFSFVLTSYNFAVLHFVYNETWGIWRIGKVGNTGILIVFTIAIIKGILDHINIIKNINLKLLLSFVITYIINIVLSGIVHSGIHQLIEIPLLVFINILPAYFFSKIVDFIELEKKKT